MGRDVESILIEEKGIYRCPHCCFKGTEGDVLRAYRELNRRVARGSLRKVLGRRR